MECSDSEGSTVARHAVTVRAALLLLSRWRFQTYVEAGCWMMDDGCSKKITENSGMSGKTSEVPSIFGGPPTTNTNVQAIKVAS